MKYYAGIGSRETPEEMLNYIERIAYYLARKEFTLRSGGADGADEAFETGCNKAKGNKEIFLPWKGFQGSDSNLILNNQKAYEIAEKYHPYWHNLSEGARKLQARNSYQVLGWNLETPSDFIICWTKNGSGSGGTGQAIRIAKAYNIPVFDLGNYKTVDEVKIDIKQFLEKWL